MGATKKPRSYLRLVLEYIGEDSVAMLSNEGVPFEDLDALACRSAVLCCMSTARRTNGARTPPF